MIRHQDKSLRHIQFDFIITSIIPRSTHDIFSTLIHGKHEVTRCEELINRNEYGTVTPLSVNNEIVKYIILKRPK